MTHGRRGVKEGKHPSPKTVVSHNNKGVTLSEVLLGVKVEIIGGGLGAEEVRGIMLVEFDLVIEGISDNRVI